MRKQKYYADQVFEKVVEAVKEIAKTETSKKTHLTGLKKPLVHFHKLYKKAKYYMHQSHKFSQQTN